MTAVCPLFFLGVSQGWNLCSDVPVFPLTFMITGWSVPFCIFHAFTTVAFLQSCRLRCRCMVGACRLCLFISAVRRWMLWYRPAPGLLLGWQSYYVDKCKHRLSLYVIWLLDMNLLMLLRFQNVSCRSVSVGFAEKPRFSVWFRFSWLMRCKLLHD